MKELNRIVVNVLEILEGLKGNGISAGISQKN
jgi:hypothetical protein